MSKPACASAAWSCAGAAAAVTGDADGFVPFRLLTVVVLLDAGEAAPAGTYDPSSGSSGDPGPRRPERAGAT